MSDLISRQTAIDDIETVNPSMPLNVNWVKNWVKTLPSAQPVIRCKDCKHFGGGTYCYERDGLWDENDFCSYAERKEK